MNSTQPMFQLWKGGMADNPEETVELNRDSRRYIKVRLHNVKVSYNIISGKKNEHKTIHELERCSETLFKTEYEKKYYKEVVSQKFMYCANHTDISLEGTKNDVVYKNDHSYIYYEIIRCHKLNVDESVHNPDCKGLGCV